MHQKAYKNVHCLTSNCNGHQVVTILCSIIMQAINKLWYIHTNDAGYTAREITEISDTESHIHNCWVNKARNKRTHIL